MPLLFWLILYKKRRNGVDEQLLLLDEPAITQLKKRLLDDMREDLANRGLRFDEEKIATFETDLLTEYLYNKKLNVRPQSCEVWEVEALTAWCCRVRHVQEPSTVAQVGFIYYSCTLASVAMAGVWSVLTCS